MRLLCSGAIHAYMNPKEAYLVIMELNWTAQSLNTPKSLPLPTIFERCWICLKEGNLRLLRVCARILFAMTAMTVKCLSTYGR